MLRRKMLRDIRFNITQFITIFLMVFLGITIYAGIRSYMDGMVQTADVFYKENNLQDLNALGQNFTDEDIENMKKTEHVKNIERKLTVLGNLKSEKDLTLQINFI